MHLHVYVCWVQVLSRSLRSEFLMSNPRLDKIRVAGKPQLTQQFLTAASIAAATISFSAGTMPTLPPASSLSQIITQR